ncbi:hypothetical protein, partial [Klebsiella pneumoniae]|uniref:hypothetical protein n=1 Tax=Klebsiella pneumoniae TaxID=573 RepID=UPI003A8C0E8B
SEDEADEFKASRPDLQGAAKAPASRVQRPGEDEEEPAEVEAARDAAAPASAADADLRAEIDRAKSINAVTDLMLDPATQARLAAMAPG